MNFQLLRRYIDYFTPREILSTMIIVFSAENVISILLQSYIPESHHLTSWIIIFFISVVVSAAWGEADEDMEEFEEELEEEGL